jgi:hypothetical protein
MDKWVEKDGILDPYSNERFAHVRTVGYQRNRCVTQAISCDNQSGIINKNGWRRVGSLTPTPTSGSHTCAPSATSGTGASHK